MLSLVSLWVIQKPISSVTLIIEAHLVCAYARSSLPLQLRNILLGSPAMPHYDTEPIIDTSVPTGDWRDQLFRDGYILPRTL